jgi:hypothetical protein
LIRWDRDKIVAALIDRRSRGLPLNTSAIQKSDSPLVKAIAKHFRFHDAALLAAGIDPASVRKWSSWDKERVVDALHARRDAGLELSFAAIYRDDTPLGGGIARCFGSNGAALRAAGIDPETVGARVYRWDQADILAVLRDRKARGLALNAGAMKKSRSGLVRAASNRFGSYDAALRAAGIDPDPIRQRRPDWDRQQIIDAVRARRDQGLALNSVAVKNDPSLYQAIRGHFDSHDDALRAAGVDPASVRKRRVWDKGKILACLRGIAIEGRLSPAIAKAGNKGVMFAAIKWFGTFEAAVNAAGLTYFREGGATSHGAGHWTEQRVLQTLRDLHKDGHDLRHRPMKSDSQPLFFAAKEFFGSYVNAVREAGIDYWQMSQAQLAKERAAATIAGGETDASMAPVIATGA